MRRNLIMALACSVMSACTSLAPQVSKSATDYSSVMEEFNNQMLVTNVLRARDQIPLNFSDLPVIHGSLQLQSTAALTVPFGKLNSANNRNSLAPTVQFTSNPTFDTSSLNTQGFSLNMLQPVSPVYVQSLWASGVSKELLLHLFAESIRLPSAPGVESKAYLNQPDAEDYGSYKALVDGLVGKGADLRSFTVLEPMGLPLMYASSGTSPNPYFAADEKVTGLYSTLIGLDAASYKVGYVADSKVAGFQIYRKFPAQIALCLPGSEIASAPAPPAKPEVTPAAAATPASAALASSSAARFAAFADLDASLGSLSKFVGKRSVAAALIGKGAVSHSAQLPAAAGQGNGKAGSNASGKPGSGGGGGGGGANADLSRAVQQYRLSGILDMAGECKTEEQIAKLQTEPEFAASTTHWGDIRWRSAAEIYNYLGALARHPADTPTWTNGQRSHRLFSIDAGDVEQANAIAVVYHEKRYVVGAGAAASASQDHSLQVLSIMSQLVNIAKISGDIAITHSLEVTP